MSGVAKPIKSLALSADGKTVVAGSKSGELCLWDLTTGRLAKKERLPGAVWAVAISTDGKLLAAGGDFAGVRVWQIKPAFRLLRKLKAQRGVMAVTFNRAGRMLASGGMDQKITLWNVRTGRSVRVVSGHTSWVSVLRFGRNGRRLYSGSWDTTVRNWNLADGKLLWTSFTPKFAVNGVDTDDSGKIVVAGGDDRRLRFMRSSDGRSFRNVGAGAITGLEVLAKMGVVAVGNWRGRVRFFELKSGRLLQVFRAHAGPVHSIAVGGSQKILATGGHHGAVKIWQIP
jgi:WD40 repeat protein